jgi:hypothetical protein
MSKTESVLQSSVEEKKMDKNESIFLNTVFDNLKARLKRVEQEKRNRKEEK